MPVSVVTGEGIEDLRTRLFDGCTLGTPARRRTGSCSPGGQIARFTARRRRHGDNRHRAVGARIAVGDRVAVSPSGLAARVRSIHAQNRPTERGEAGQRCAFNLAGDGVTKDAIARGDVVLDDALHAPSARIDAQLRVLASETRPIAQWTPVRLHHAAADVAARIVLLSDPVAPGAQACVQLVLDQAIAAAVGDRFVIRDTTAQRTIGGGRFLDLRAPARKRRAPERIALLDACALTDHGAALTALLDRAPHVVDLEAFARDRALAASAVDGFVARGAVIRIAGTTLGLSPAVWGKLRRTLLDTLKTFHTAHPDLQGMGLERLRLQTEPRLPARSFLAMLQSLARGRDVALDGAWVRLPTHEVRLMGADEKLWARVQPLLSGAERFRPPRVRDIANALDVGEADVRRLLKLLGRMGKVDEVAHDHFFLRLTIAEIVAIATDVAAHAEANQFSAAQLRDRLDNGRKVAIQILEFFDRHGVTMRRGDLRRINKHRLDLFGSPADDAENGREASPVGRPDFKSGRGREPVLGGFDSLSLPPATRRSATMTPFLDTLAHPRPAPSRRRPRSARRLPPAPRRSSGSAPSRSAA